MYNKTPRIQSWKLRYSGFLREDTKTAIHMYLELKTTVTRSSYISMMIMKYIFELTIPEGFVDT